MNYSKSFILQLELIITAVIRYIQTFMSDKKQRVLNLPDISTSITQKLLQISFKQPNVDKNILLNIKGNQAHIIFNRPQKMNSFSIDMYLTLNEYINWANQNPNIKFIVISGSGDNFSSGNDLSNFYLEELQGLDIKLLSKGMAEFLQTLTASILNSQKPIFAVVFGKCVGFAFTQLALYDRVFATQDTFFMAPLVRIAQGPQMCSSFTFPKIFGQNLAEDFIIKGKSTTTKQLQKYNFVKSCPSKQQAFIDLEAHIKQIEQLDWKSYIEARKLMRKQQVSLLHQINQNQCKNLIERWSNPDLPEYLMNYMQKKKNMKPKL